MASPNFWGNLIRQLREERGISQRELARRTGLNRSMLRGLERGTQTYMSIAAVETVLSVFGYELDAFASTDRRAS